MYAWIWRKLPYGLPGKLAGSAIIFTTVVTLLWYVIFPWIEPLFPFDDVQVTPDSGVPAPIFSSAEPTGGEHDLHYDTTENNTPPPSPSR